MTKNQPAGWFFAFSNTLLNEGISTVGIFPGVPWMRNQKLFFQGWKQVKEIREKNEYKILNPREYFSEDTNRVVDKINISHAFCHCFVMLRMV